MIIILFVLCFHYIKQMLKRQFTVGKGWRCKKEKE